MTGEEFLAFYPWFGSVPQIVLETYTEQANLRFSECEDAAEEARRLYIAHKLTLYAQTYTAPTAAGTPIAAAMSKLAGSGVSAQALSKSVGGVSVSKTEGSAVSSISGYGELKQTEYGLQLIGLLKTATAGGRWVP